MARDIESKLTPGQAQDVAFQLEIQMGKIKRDIAVITRGGYTGEMVGSMATWLQEREIFQQGLLLGSGVLPPNVGPYSRLMAGIVIKDEETPIAENGTGKCATHQREENVRMQLEVLINNLGSEGGDKNVYAARVGLRLLEAIFSSDPTKRIVTLSHQDGEGQELITIDASRELLKAEKEI